MVPDDLEIEEGSAVKAPDEALQYVAPPDAPRGPQVGRVQPQPNPGRVFNVGDDEIEAQRRLNEVDGTHVEQADK